MSTFGYIPEYSEASDIDKLRLYLTPHEPWEKAEYTSIPMKEREAHARLRHTIEQVKSR